MPVVKKPKKVSSRQKTASAKSSAGQQNETEETKKFIAINEYDPDMEFKGQMVWVIVGILTIILLGFWFWSMKKNLEQTSLKRQEQIGISQTISNAVNQIKDNFSQAKEILTEADKKLAEKYELEIIKQEVLEKIQQSIDQTDWPTHQSDVLGLSVQYPTDWQKEEIGNLLELTVETGNLATTTTSTLSKIVTKITISRVDDNQETDLSEWITTNNFFNRVLDLDQYEPMTTDTLIDNQPLLKYVKASDQDINWLIITKSEERVYEIAISSNGGQGFYEPIIEKILSTIKFTKLQ